MGTFGTHTCALCKQRHGWTVFCFHHQVMPKTNCNLCCDFNNPNTSNVSFHASCAVKAGLTRIITCGQGAGMVCKRSVKYRRQLCGLKSKHSDFAAESMRALSGINVLLPLPNTPKRFHDEVALNESIVPRKGMRYNTSNARHPSGQPRINHHAPDVTDVIMGYVNHALQVSSDPEHLKRVLIQRIEGVFVQG